jgi:hypothetical protein
MEVTSGGHTQSVKFSLADDGKTIDLLSSNKKTNAIITKGAH